MKSRYLLPPLAALFSVSAIAAADMVFINGSIYTVNNAAPWAQALAVEGNKITYVGNRSGVNEHIGEKTEVYDLNGKMLMPGFFSAHEHLIASAWTGLGVNLGAGSSKQEYLNMIKAYADANPKLKFIRGFGWNVTLLGGNPTAADLDAIVPDRPVILQDYTIHDMWMNSKMMEMAGINKDTPDPIPGLTYWVRDEQGNPTGYAKEFAWMGAYIKAGAWEAEKMITSSQVDLYTTAASYGMTGYVNQGLVTPNVKTLSAYKADHEIALGILSRQQKEGTLKLRTFMQLLYKNEAITVPDMVEFATETKADFNTDLIRVTGIKVHPEGVYTSYASVMLEPWSDKPELVSKRGISAKRTEEIVMAGNKAGFDVSVHVDGSRTVRETIDAFITAKNSGYKDARNSLQHFANVHPDDLARVIKYKIPVNLTPIWATSWGGGLDSSMQIIGEYRMRKAFQPIRAAIDGGTNVSISADIPSTGIESASPLTQCEAAITRRDPSNSEDTRIFPPMEQALTLEQCLKAITLGGAYEARMETKVGSLEAGKLADLVILEKNLFDVESGNIADVKVIATIMDGNFTYNTGLK